MSPMRSTELHGFKPKVNKNSIECKITVQDNTTLYNKT